MEKEVLICCLCGKEITNTEYYGDENYLGNNPWPLSDKPMDRCCDVCNCTKVIPARIKLFAERG